VHPCYVSVWEGNAGSEYSTWANITSGEEPDLVTAQGSTLRIHSLCQKTGKLILVESFPNLYGNVCFLDTLQNPDSQSEGSDALLLGFSGHPRLAVVTIQTACPKFLLGSTLFDLSPVLQEMSYGSVAPLEQDLQATLLQKPINTATISVALGGGIALACLQLRHTSGLGWQAMEDKPYLLPLQSLSAVIDDQSGSNGTSSNIKDAVLSVVTGFGDILSTTFLPGYLEPTIVILHSNPHSGGRSWSGRLGRHEGGTRHAMVLTAVTVTVSHHRSAMLWGTQVPADALHVYPTGDGCLVQCVNSILAVSNVGQIQQCLAVNGWARSTMTSDYTVHANPWPFPKLSIALDGAQISFVTDKAAFCMLRCGQIFLLQYTDSWSLLPLYKNVGAIGQIANLSCWSLGNVLPNKILESKLLDSPEKLKEKVVKTGLLFCGSRLGDSSLLGYALETTSMADAMQGNSVLQNPRLKGICTETEDAEASDSEYDRILQAEESALYATTTDDAGSRPTIIPPSDDDEESNYQAASQQRKRARLSQLIVVRALTSLDSLTALGPLGPGCKGPLSKTVEANKDEALLSANAAPSFGAPGYIFPCGFGSSGGLALLTAPGKDDRSIIAEEDCINAKAIFNLPSRGLVILSTVNGIRFLRLIGNDQENVNDVKIESSKEGQTDSLEEIALDEWCSDETRKSVLAENALLLTASEINDEDFCVLVGIPVDENSMAYSVFILSDSTGQLVIKAKNTLPVPKGALINAMTPIQLNSNSKTLVFGCTLSNGDVRLFTFNKLGNLDHQIFESVATMDLETEEDNEEEIYYSNSTVVAIDLFEAPKSFFISKPPESKYEKDDSMENNSLGDALPDEDDQELYGDSTLLSSGNKDDMHSTSDEAELEEEEEEASFFALCRQSGILEIYEVAEVLSSGQKAIPIWTTYGASHGVPQLLPQRQGGSAYRAPRSHKVSVDEIRFFFCGPSSNEITSTFGSPRIFCVAMETSDGDTLVYSADSSNLSGSSRTFSRVQMKNVSRPSQEQSKHLSKLRRKGIVDANGANDSANGFRHNHLFPFQNLSGQDGLFAAVARPLWLIAERGQPTFLCHRLRHVAPAGASSRPVVGFCSGLLVS
jgi:cleavage and polyadenylation specificity factor subunit 1